jgi:hypothetical protein
MAGVLVCACGVSPDQPPNDNTLELTLVLIDQYDSSPVLLTPPGEPPLYRVTADVTVAFRFANQLETLLVDLEDPVSGRRTHNEFDLTVVAPELAAMTNGREPVRVPLTIPELGTLQFSVTLINHDGTTSGAVEGGFTVQSTLGADDSSQTQTTQVGTTT